MSDPIKFNDAGGDSDQRYCQDGCGILDNANGITERVNENGVAFDVYYTLPDYGSGPELELHTGLAKCSGCPKLENHAGV